MSLKSRPVSGSDMTYTLPNRRIRFLRLVKLWITEDGIKWGCFWGARLSLATASTTL
jgi:hypothetical protein